MGKKIITRSGLSEGGGFPVGMYAAELRVGPDTLAKQGGSRLFAASHRRNSSLEASVHECARASMGPNLIGPALFAVRSRLRVGV